MILKGVAFLKHKILQEASIWDSAYLLAPQAHIRAVWCSIIWCFPYTSYNSDYARWVITQFWSQVLQNRFKDHKTALSSPCHQGDAAAAFNSTVKRALEEME